MEIETFHKKDLKHHLNRSINELFPLPDGVSIEDVRLVIDSFGLTGEALPWTNLSPNDNLPRPDLTSFTSAAEASHQLQQEPSTNNIDFQNETHTSQNYPHLDAGSTTWPSLHNDDHLDYD
jgi:hypothetical protein